MDNMVMSDDTMGINDDQTIQQPTKQSKMSEV